MRLLETVLTLPFPFPNLASSSHGSRKEAPWKFWVQDFKRKQAAKHFFGKEYTYAGVPWVHRGEVRSHPGGQCVPDLGWLEQAGQGRGGWAGV